MNQTIKQARTLAGAIHKQRLARYNARKAIGENPLPIVTVNSPNPFTTPPVAIRPHPAMNMQPPPIYGTHHPSDALKCLSSEQLRNIAIQEN